jgi:diphosphate-dependent phosphofructokinase
VTVCYQWTILLITPLQVQKLIAELNEILAHDVVDEAGAWKSKLQPECSELFDFLPKTIQEQLMLERDPHGNVQVTQREC